MPLYFRQAVLNYFINSYKKKKQNSVFLKKKKKKIYNRIYVTGNGWWQWEAMKFSWESCRYYTFKNTKFRLKSFKE